MRQTDLALRVDLNGIDIVETGKFERETMRTFEGDGVSFDRLNSVIWDNGLSTFQNWRNTNLFPLYRHLNRTFTPGGRRNQSH